MAVKIGVVTARPHVDDILAAANGIDLNSKGVLLTHQAIRGIEQSLFPAFARHVIEIYTHLSIAGASCSSEVVTERQHLVAAG